MHTVVVVAQKPFSKNSVAAMQELAKSFPELKVEYVQSFKDMAELYPHLAEAEAVIVRSDKVDAAFLAAAPKLKLVVRAGAGYDTIDCALCTEKGIVVMNTPGQNSNGVAELAFGEAITALRHGFNGKSGHELRGRKLGLQAFGAVARCMARIALGFGMEVYTYDPYVKAEDAAAAGVKMVSSLAELYKTCDVISLHTPLTPETRGCVNAELLNEFSANGLLINSARVEIVDEEALKAKFAAAAGFMYAADVAPKCAAELKEKYGDRCVFSSVKSGAQTEEANTNCGTAGLKQIDAFFATGCTKFQVNKAK